MTLTRFGRSALVALLVLLGVLYLIGGIKLVVGCIVGVAAGIILTVESIAKGTPTATHGPANLPDHHARPAK